MSTIIIEQVNTGHELYPQVWRLREDLLRRPLGLSLEDEDLSADATDAVFAAVKAGTVTGCVMMHPVNAAEVKLRQMAVAESMQGTGTGRKLVAAAEQWAKEQGFTRITMHARLTATGFYEKLGYLATDPVFTEVTIPHIRMYKDI